MQIFLYTVMHLLLTIACNYSANYFLTFTTLSCLVRPCCPPPLSSLPPMTLSMLQNHQQLYFTPVRCFISAVEVRAGHIKTHRSYASKIKTWTKGSQLCGCQPSQCLTSGFPCLVSPLPLFSLLLLLLLTLVVLQKSLHLPVVVNVYFFNLALEELYHTRKKRE